MHAICTPYARLIHTILQHVSGTCHALWMLHLGLCISSYSMWNIHTLHILELTLRVAVYATHHITQHNHTHIPPNYTQYSQSHSTQFYPISFNLPHKSFEQVFFYSSHFHFWRFDSTVYTPRYAIQIHGSDSASMCNRWTTTSGASNCYPKPAITSNIIKKWNGELNCVLQSCAVPVDRAETESHRPAHSTKDVENRQEHVNLYSLLEMHAWTEMHTGAYTDVYRSICRRVQLSRNAYRSTYADVCSFLEMHTGAYAIT